MSEKSTDKNGRWRSKTIGFRMSEDENKELDMLVALSGMTKQDYIIHKLLNKDIVVHGNPRIFKALKTLLLEIHSKLMNYRLASDIPPELIDTIKTISRFYDALTNDSTTHISL